MQSEQRSDVTNCWSRIVLLLWPAAATAVAATGAITDDSGLTVVISFDLSFLTF